MSDEEVAAGADPLGELRSTVGDLSYFSAQQGLPHGLALAILESDPDLCLVVNDRRVIVWSNARARETFGYPYGLAGRLVDDLVPEEHRERHAAFVETFFADPSPRPMGLGRKLMARHHDGWSFPVEIALNAVAFPGPRLVTVKIRDLRRWESGVAAGG